MKWFLVFGSGIALIAATAASAGPFNYDFYGASRSPATLAWENIEYDMEAGYAVGASISTEQWTPGIELGIDVMYGETEYTCCAGNGLRTTSLMATASYAFPLASGFEVYAGAGVGGIFAEYFNTNPSAEFDGVAFGGQVSLGARYQVASNYSLFGEVKYQAAFDDVQASDNAGQTFEYNSLNLLVGLRTSF